MAGRSPSTTTPKILGSAIRVPESRPCEPSPSAECRSSARPPCPPRPVARVDLQLRSVMNNLVQGGRPPPLSSSAGGRATTQHARSLFVSIIARGTTHCATTLTTRNATRMCKIYVGLTPRTVREPVRPRVTEQCVSPSLHSASQSVGPGRKAVRKGVLPPKPTANQEAGMDATHGDKRKAERSVFGHL